MREGLVADISEIETRIDHDRLQRSMSLDSEFDKQSRHDFGDLEGAPQSKIIDKEYLDL